MTKEVRKNRSIYKSRNKRTKQSFNPKTAETDDGGASTSARKLKSQDEYHVPETDTVDYRIINIVTVLQDGDCKSWEMCKVQQKIVCFDTRGQNGRLALCIEPYFSLQIHANLSWLTVYRHRKCAATQLHSQAVNTTI